MSGSLSIHPKSDGCCTNACRRLYSRCHKAQRTERQTQPRQRWSHPPQGPTTTWTSQEDEGSPRGSSSCAATSSTVTADHQGPPGLSQLSHDASQVLVVDRHRNWTPFQIPRNVKRSAEGHHHHHHHSFIHSSIYSFIHWKTCQAPFKKSTHCVATLALKFLYNFSSILFVWWH